MAENMLPRGAFFLWLMANLGAMPLLSKDHWIPHVLFALLMIGITISIIRVADHEDKQSNRIAELEVENARLKGESNWIALS